ncbi:transcription termination factor, mitochondrial-like [Limulus polyphemus]|uniref:Transcription termination factor, mitochondrial-like n=1 Tax=Limulus polyphemus TaxID=6850 RepID=A0ABM1TH31_LIMPO|nr:transcription termination factor, mitochondrial-like [Limulus polyphemus]
MFSFVKTIGIFIPRRISRTSETTITKLNQSFYIKRNETLKCLLFQCSTKLSSNNEILYKNGKHRYLSTFLCGRNYFKVTKLHVQYLTTDTSMSYSEVISYLAESLQCTHDEMKGIAKNYPRMLKHSSDKLLEILCLLHKVGYTKQQILDHPWLLSYSKFTLQRKLGILQEANIIDNIPLLLISEYKLRRVINQIKRYSGTTPNLTILDLNERIEYFEQYLQVNRAQVINLLQQHPYLLTMNLDRIKNIMEMMLKAGVTPLSIKKDLWIFLHNEEVMNSRIAQCQALDIPVKPWMLRCPENTFLNSIRRWREKREVFGDHYDARKYLAERLQCSTDYVKVLVEKNNQILSINPPKLKQILDFLLDSGFTPYQVCQFPRVLSHSFKTIKQRVTELQAARFQLGSLRVLCLTRKEYQRLLRKLRMCPLTKKGLSVKDS